MRTYFQLILMIITFVVSSSSVLGQSKKIEKATIQSNFYCDHCEKCETCGQNFEANLRRVRGLKDYKLNESEMTITVFYKTNKTDLPTIRKAISQLGFKADDIAPDSAAYERLDNCCKK